MKIPEPQHTLVALVDRYHEGEQAKKPKRMHFGVSSLGHHCERYLWLAFRWAYDKPFPGRMLRLFRRGHLEEITLIADLKAAGLVFLDPQPGEQHHVDFGSFVSGSLDGIILEGVPKAETKKHVAEFKTHSRKSFDDLVKKGVELSKPMHYVQMQVYMYGTNIDRALYVAVNKDTDALYTERVKLDKKLAEHYVKRGKRIALSQELPPPISNDPTWWQCKMCDKHSFCHGEKKTNSVNCRTCALGEPLQDSTWHCHKWDRKIPNEWQPKGCPAHVLHHDLVPWQSVDTDKEMVGKFMVGGRAVYNGLDHYSSQEMLANAEACAAGDQFTDAIRDKFNARVVE